ncbi:MAG: 50S ribosomal protein L21 [Anaerolineae bacterium]
MYALVETGGKQYKVAVGETVDVEKLAVAVGEAVELDRVLMVAGDDGVSVGHPVVDGAKVSATVVSHGRGRKVITFKYRPKKHSRSKTGHRQDYTRLRIDGITV